MGQAGIIPGFGIMALCTRTRVMIAWSSVTVGTGRAAIVSEPDLSPVVDVMAGGALARFMWFWRCVAARTIVLAVVVKGHFMPGIGSVACGAKPRIMEGWCLIGVAALAIIQAAVIDDEGSPVGGIVAVGAISIGMGWRRFMAG